MSEKWLDDMIDEIRVKEAELANLKRAANTFFKSKELPQPYPDTESDDATSSSATMRLRPDEFYGKGFATASRLYLEKRKQAVAADEILAALDRGGFDFNGIGWKDENRARTVAMSLAKNNALFHRLPNGMFGLREWYQEAIQKKKGKKGEAEEAANE